EVRLPEPQAEVVWAEAQPLAARPLAKLPGWWADKPDPAGLSDSQKAMIEEAWLALIDWAGWLARVESPVYAVKARVREEKDNPTAQRLGLFFLAALGS